MLDVSGSQERDAENTGCVQAANGDNTKRPHPSNEHFLALAMCVELFDLPVELASEICHAQLSAALNRVHHFRTDQGAQCRSVLSGVHSGVA